MDIHTLGWCVLPAVIALLAFSTLLTLLAGAFALVRAALHMRRGMYGYWRDEVVLRILVNGEPAPPPMQDDIHD